MGYYFKIKVEREIDKASLLEKCNLRHWGVKVKENHIKVACDYQNPDIVRAILQEAGVDILSCQLKETDKKWVDKYINHLSLYKAHTEDRVLEEDDREYGNDY